jgi:hypothetical protein
MVRICEQFGSFKMHPKSRPSRHDRRGPPARWDAARNFVKTGGRLSKRAAVVLAARTNYFRETYAYGNEERVEGTSFSTTRIIAGARASDARS